MEITLFSAFLIGLFSTLHCLGMCGGIIGALTLSLPESIRNNRWRLLPYVSLYSIGRIGSYTLAGALAGGIGGNLLKLFPHYGHLVLQLFASLLMLGIGLYLAGWFPAFARIEHIGRPIWKKLEPLSQSLLPIKNPRHALLFGFIWGWLPCGLVYSILIWSTTASSALDGALLMLSFGLGTLPTILIAGILTGWFAGLSGLARLRPWIGSTIILMALVSAFLALQHTNSTHSHHPQLDSRYEKTDTD